MCIFSLNAALQGSHVCTQFITSRNGRKHLCGVPIMHWQWHEGRYQRNEPSNQNYKAGIHICDPQKFKKLPGTWTNNGKLNNANNTFFSSVFLSLESMGNAVLYQEQVFADWKFCINTVAMSQSKYNGILIYIRLWLHHQLSFSSSAIGELDRYFRSVNRWNKLIRNLALCQVGTTHIPQNSRSQVWADRSHFRRIMPEAHFRNITVVWSVLSSVL